MKKLNKDAEIFFIFKDGALIAYAEGIDGLNKLEAWIAKNKLIPYTLFKQGHFPVGNFKRD